MTFSLPARLLAGAALALVLAGCATSTEPTASISPAAETPTFWTGFRDHPHGYLEEGAAPNAANFLPPPPAPGSLREQDDIAQYRATRALKGTTRWEQAAADNEIETPSAPRIFNEALGIEFVPEQMPTLTRLLGRMLGDLETIQTPAKRGYFRHRPFVVEPLETCFTPEPWLGPSGSYPSGHTALGFAWALVLAEMAPDRADQILARGIAYGESRMICGVHYASDVEAGRIVGAVIVAALKANPEFQADFEVAAEELRRVRQAQAR
ncbi:MAG: phosphatase PAP2 family protein [Brevundimonas sp.]|nr:phosphatase PAP2 family protein [Brevundimonas sp.]